MAKVLVLVIDTNATLLAGGNFQTDGPTLDYMLDFIFNYDFYANVDIHVSLPDPFPNINEDLFTIDTANNYSTNIINYHSDTSPPINFTLPDPLGSISVELAWPNLEVSGTETSSGIYEGDGSSNNALQVDLDIDKALADIFFGGANPFNANVSAGFADASLELLDADVLAGLNFLQDFLLDAGTIAATLNWEDGTTSSFNFGDELNFPNASDIDKGGDNDGQVEFTVGLDLVGSTLANDTNLGFNVGWNFDLLQGDWSYGVDLGVLGSIGDSGDWGPLVDLGQNQIPVAEIDVFNTTVNVDFVGVSPVVLYA